MMAVLSAMFNTLFELLSLVWMELVMLTVAGLGFVAFHGVPLKASASKKIDKTFEDEGPSEEEALSRDIQNQLAAGNHQAVYKLWQRAKSYDMPSGLPLASIVESMQKLGKSAESILSEIRSAMECNDALFTSDAVHALLEALRKKEENSELVCGLTQIFETSDGARAAKVRSSKSCFAALEGALKGGRLDEALTHLERMPAANRRDKSNFTPPVELVTRLLAVAGRQHRLLEVAPRLDGFNMPLEPRMLNELLAEAVRRRDAVFCRQVHRFSAQAGVAKDAQTYELLVSGFALDNAAVEALFEEALGDPAMQITEAFGLAMLNACATGRNSTLAARVFDALTPAFGASPDHAFYAALLRVYAACDLHDKVCDVYEQEMTPRSIKPDSLVSDIIMKSAVQCGRSALAQTVFAGCSGDINKHIAMIKACSRESDLQGALKVFDQLKQSGACLNSMVYNSVLDACIQCQDPLRACDFFESMKRDNVVDVVSFNIMLKTHLKEGQHEKAQRLLAEMRECGHPANTITYNQLINAKVASGDRRGAWNLISQMQDEGVSPNSVTCSVLFKSLTARSTVDDMKRTMALVDQIQDSMDEVLFSSVIEACLRMGQLDMLSEQMRKYARQGGLVALTAPTYGSMIKAYGQARDTERMWELWSEMEKRHVKPTAVTLGCMVDALVKNQHVEAAWDLVHGLLSDPARSGLVNNIIYSTILKGFAMSKQTERLFAVYSEIQARGVEANTITYNTMMDACARCGAMDRVPQLVADMRAANIPMDTITYSTLVKGHCLSGNVDRAFEVLAEMRADGRHMPDEILYNCLLDGCAKEHRLEEALKLYEEMKAQGVRPSNFTLCTLVKLLGRARRLPQAFAVMEELSTKCGLKPNVQVFTCLLQACIHNRQLQRALEVHDEMIASKCEPDQKTYTVLVRGCLFGGNLMKAVEVVRCAYLLPGHGLTLPSKMYGVETKVLEEVVMRLNQGSPADAETGRELLCELKRHCGLNMQDNVYSQVVREAARHTNQRGQSRHLGGRW